MSNPEMVATKSEERPAAEAQNGAETKPSAPTAADAPPSSTETKPPAASEEPFTTAATASTEIKQDTVSIPATAAPTNGHKVQTPMPRTNAVPEPPSNGSKAPATSEKPSEDVPTGKADAMQVEPSVEPPAVAAPTTTSGEEPVQPSPRTNAHAEPARNDETKPPAALEEPSADAPAVTNETSRVVSSEEKPPATNGETEPPANSPSEAVAEQPPADAVMTDAKPEETEDTGESTPLEEEDELDDEEEKMFQDLEHEQEEKDKEEALHPHAQPKDISEAPKLLQAALKQGDIKPDESEEEESKLGAADKAKDSENHVHHRGSQLEHLLSRASEYSGFIAEDLKKLQDDMAEQARSAMEAKEGGGKKKSKKRKGSSKEKAAAKKAKVKAGKQALSKTIDAENAKDKGTKKAIFKQPDTLAEGCFLKDYQLEGVRWLVSLFENGVSGILADEMGLGKTIQVIGLLAHLQTMGVSGPFLVVAPLATLPNWVREINKWLPQQPVVRYHGTAQEREAMLRGPLNRAHRKNPEFPFIVTSYEVAIRDQGKLEKLKTFGYVIVDEGHRLKNHRCTLLSSLKRLETSNRLLLTGTPIQNTLDELWSLLNFVNPSIFDDLAIFQSWFGFKNIGQKTFGATDEESILLEQRKNQTVSKLHECLRPFLLRRVKSDVLSELPDKKEVIVYSGISKLQAGYADLIEAGTLRDTLISQGIEDGRTLSQTNKLMNHRKNVNHPFLFGEPVDPVTGVHVGTSHPQLLVRASGKFNLLDRMLQRLHKDGHQVLIFSQMTKVMNVMEDYLNFRKWNYCRIDGSTNIDVRQQQMDQFNAEKTAGVDGGRNYSDDRTFVFLLSTRAGGLGINLTSADTCIIFDSDWNPHADSQAMDRCHRMGQTLPVAVYRLLTVNSVDIEMMEKQISKKKLERMTIAGGDFRKAGQRSRTDGSDFSTSFLDQLSTLLESDVKDLQAKGGEVENIKISDEEFDMIMDRKRLFETNPDKAVPTEGKMYDILDAEKGDMLGSMGAGTLADQARQAEQQTASQTSQTPSL